MRIGLYGGSFDPIHLGHKLVARAALEELALDRILFIPASLSPFKPGTRPAPAEWRLRWLRMAMAGESRCDLDLLELERGGTSFTIDTVRAMNRRFPDAELFWMIGQDHVPTLPAWREAETLAGLVQFVVIPRPGAPGATLPPVYRLHWIKGWPLQVSSSGIRERIVCGLPVDHLVDRCVANSILETGAYRGAD